MFYFGSSLIWKGSSGRVSEVYKRYNPDFDGKYILPACSLMNDVSTNPLPRRVPCQRRCCKACPLTSNHANVGNAPKVEQPQMMCEMVHNGKWRAGYGRRGVTDCRAQVRVKPSFSKRRQARQLTDVTFNRRGLSLGRV